MMHAPDGSPPAARRRVRRGSLLTRSLLVAAVLLALGAVAVPVYLTIRARAHKAVATANLARLAGAAGQWAAQHGGMLPDEDFQGAETWASIGDPANTRAWYNALPPLAGGSAAATFAGEPRGFYSGANLLWLPGAEYPAGRLARPMFAVAWNNRLQQRDIDGRKQPVRVSEIAEPARTVLLFEQGLPGEAKASPVQPKYDGACKGNGRTFVARYGTKGLLAFCDGHVEPARVEEFLTETGRLVFPGEVVWSRRVDEDPNR